MSSIRITRLLPELMNLNGSLGNAEVLAMRARWWGLDVDIHDATATDPLGAEPNLVVIGHGTTSTLQLAAQALEGWRETVASWWSAGVVFVGCGLGGDLLGQEVVAADGQTYRGVGISPLSTRLGGTRYAGEVVGVDYRGRPCAGYLNDHTTRSGSINTPLLRISTGPDDRWSGASLPGAEGYVDQRLWISALSGPVFALNPALADDVLHTLWPHTDGPLPQATEHHRLADERATAARGAITKRLR